jgi:hypothetical protein
MAIKRIARAVKGASISSTNLSDIAAFLKRGPVFALGPSSLLSTFSRSIAETTPAPLMRLATTVCACVFYSPGLSVWAAWRTEAPFRDDPLLAPAALFASSPLLPLPTSLLRQPSMPFELPWPRSSWKLLNTKRTIDIWVHTVSQWKQTEFFSRIELGIQTLGFVHEISTVSSSNA